MTVHFYGQAPSKGDPPGKVAFRGAPHGLFLAGLAGVSVSELHDQIRFRNLLSEWPGRDDGAKGDRFPLVDASLAADQEMLEWEDGDRIVFAGRKVALAFGFIHMAWFIWEDVHVPPFTVRAASFPHPSRINTFWNDELHVAAARGFMQSLVRQED